MMRTLTLSLLLAAPVVAAPAPLPKIDRHSDALKIRGEWVVVLEEGTTLIPLARGDVLSHFSHRPVGRTATVTGDRISWLVRGEVVGEELIRLDRGRVELTSTTTHQTRRGVYVVDGDTLTVCTSPVG